MPLIIMGGRRHHDRWGGLKVCERECQTLRSHGLVDSEGDPGFLGLTLVAGFSLWRHLSDPRHFRSSIREECQSAAAISIVGMTYRDRATSSVGVCPGYTEAESP